MNKLLLAAIAFMILTTSVHAAIDSEMFQPSMVVDSTDTVYFNLADLEIQGNTASFPVLINTDDTIYALDFSFRYNMNTIIYDSIIELTNYMQSFYYFNTNDSTLRYTSYSIQPYSTDTALVAVKFNLNSQPTLTDSDLFDLKGYLNGTACTVKILSTTTGIHTPDETMPLSVYPDPATSTIYIHTKAGADITLFSLSGTKLIETTSQSSILNTMDIASLPAGIYMIRVTDGQSSAMQKLIKL
jgi:hypothetical protein